MAESQSPSRVAIVKEKIESELGSEGYELYTKLLQDWFGNRLTKDVLVHELHSLFDGKRLALHNQLMQAVLRDCMRARTDIGGASPGLPLPYFFGRRCKITERPKMAARAVLNTSREMEM